jgi:hypothetical protein
MLRSSLPIGFGYELKEPGLERFRAKWTPVRVKKTRQNKKIERGCDSIQSERALVCIDGELGSLTHERSVFVSHSFSRPRRHIQQSNKQDKNFYMLQDVPQ